MKNLTSEQRNLLDRLRERAPELVVEWNETRGVAARIRGELLESSEKPQEAIFEFLEDFGPLFGPSDLVRRLDPSRERTDELGWTHLTFQQVLRTEEIRENRAPLEIHGSILAAHFDKDGRLIEVQSSCWRDVEEVPLEPELSPDELQQRLFEEAAQAPGFQELRERMRQREEENFPIIGLAPLSWTHSYATSDASSYSVGLR